MTAHGAWRVITRRATRMTAATLLAVVAVVGAVTPPATASAGDIRTSVAVPDIATWNVSLDGIGPLVLGMSSAETLAAVPALTPGEYDGSSVLVIDGFPVIGLEFADDSLVRVTVGQLYENYPGALPTADGLGVGTPAADVAAAFPGGSYVNVRVAGQADYIVTDRAGHALSFTGVFLADATSTSTLTGFVVENAAITRTRQFAGLG